MTWREVGGRVLNLALHPLEVELQSLRATKHSEVWEQDEQFAAIAQTVRGRSLLSVQKLFVLWQFARYANSLDPNAECAEVGVYKGGSAWLVASVCQGRTFHGFDTFAGVPETEPGRIAEGVYAATLDSVRSYLSPLRNCALYPGRFPSTAEGIRTRTFCIVHLDGDLYSTTRDGLDFFHPRMIYGGVIVVDDYGTYLAGVTEAVEEFVRRTQTVPLVLADGQCVLIKVDN